MSPRSKLRERIKETTAEAIVEAAEAVFAGEGLHEARVERIAEQAGVSVGTLYNYFGDREGLLGALVEARRKELIALLDEVLAVEEPHPFARQLERFLGALLDHFETHQAFFSILWQGEPARVGRPLSKGKPQTTLREVYERFSRLIARGLAAQALRPELADLYPAILTSIFRGVVLRTLAEPHGPPPRERTQQLARFFLEGAGTHALAERT